MKDFILDEEDIMLIMMKNIHFGGSIEEMLEYYEDIKLLDFSYEASLEKLKKLQELEIDGIVLEDQLTKEDKESIEQKKYLYEKIVNMSEKGSESEKAVANLVLASDVDFEEEVEEIEKMEDDVIPLLISVITEEDYYSKLSPGQGNAPIAALRALTELGEDTLTSILFDKFFNVSSFVESAFMKYFKKFEDQTLALIKKILKRKEWSKDHEKAVSIAGSLKFDIEVSELCFDILKNKERCPENIGYQSYLAIISNGDNENDCDRRNEIQTLDHVDAKAKQILFY